MLSVVCFDEHNVTRRPSIAQASYLSGSVYRWCVNCIILSFGSIISVFFFCFVSSIRCLVVVVVGALGVVD